MLGKHTNMANKIDSRSVPTEIDTCTSTIQPSPWRQLLIKLMSLSLQYDYVKIINKLKIRRTLKLNRQYLESRLNILSEVIIHNLLKHPDHIRNLSIKVILRQID